MTRILHLSDTHFGTERPGVVEALIALAQTLSPQLIVVSGDITQRATRAQFASARRFLDALPPCPQLLLPGNHDVPLFALWQRAFSPYARYCAGLGVAALAPTISLPGAPNSVNLIEWSAADGERICRWTRYDCAAEGAPFVALTPSLLALA
jgi:3',5'-cyclic AMP phosphodiesterase CpdA